MRRLRSTSIWLLIVALFITSVLSLPSSLPAKTASSSLSSNLKLRVYYNNVTGNEALSFKTEGLNYLSDVTMSYNNQWGSSEDAIRIEGLANLRATDDKQFQVRDDTLRLQNAYITAEQQEAWKLTGGYFNERFTSYTMSTSLLGINSRFNLTDGLKFHLFSGRDRRARSNNQYARYAGGSRLAWEVLSGQVFALSYVRTKDYVNSLSGEDRNSVGDTIANEVAGIDYRGSFDSLNSQLEAEVAQSNYDTAPTESIGETNDKLARRASLQSRLPRVGNFRFKYEKVDPGFRTVSGFATADRERSMVNWRNQFENIFGERWYFQGSYEQWEDGLESARSHDVTDWVFELTYDPQSEGYFNSVADLAVESREDKGSTVANDPNESERMVYSLTSENRLGESSLDLDLSYQDVSSDSEIETRYEVVYDRPFQLGSINSKILLDGIYEVQENDLGSRKAIDRRFRIGNELVLGEGARESLRLEQSYQEEHADDSEEITRLTYGVSFQYLLSRKAGNKISFSYLVNDNEDEGDPTQDYKEETFDMRIDYSF